MNTAFAESKDLFPVINEEDFTYFLSDHKKTSDQGIYVFGSLSIINLQKDPMTFKVTRKKNDNMIPLSLVERYPKIYSEIQFEYFDSTIWGQLESYFNQNIELIENENEIRSTLMELQEINDKYAARAKMTFSQFNPVHTVTINTSNYVYRLKSGSQYKERDHLRIDKNASRTNNRLKAKERYNLSPSSIRLRSELVAKMSVPKDKTLPKEGSLTTMNDREIRIDEISSNRSGWVSKVFNKIGALFVYFMRNKIEAIIYLILLVLSLRFFLMVFFRV